MSEMVERVRDAIADWMGGCQEARCTYPMSENCECALAAGAAIAAMREPTEAMMAAVIPFPEHLRPQYAPDSPWHAWMAAATIAERMGFRCRWQDAIDAALGPAQGTARSGE